MIFQSNTIERKTLITAKNSSVKNVIKLSQKSQNHPKFQYYSLNQYLRLPNPSKSLYTHLHYDKQIKKEIGGKIKKQITIVVKKMKKII